MVGLDLNAQIVWTEPAFPTADDQVTLYYDIAEGNGALLSATTFPGGPFVYAHTGVITSESTSPQTGNMSRTLAGKRKPERGEQRQRVAARGGHGPQFDFGA